LHATIFCHNRNLFIVDRIHNAVNEFRSGRVWPLPSSGLVYLWDQVCHVDLFFFFQISQWPYQFRIYVGLLGQPPVWYRTDLQENPDDVLDDYDNDEVYIPPSPPKNKDGSGKEDDVSEKSFSDGGDYLTEDANNKNDLSTEHQNEAEPQKRKRIPVRTPYAMHNIEPIPLSSASQVKTLLSLASLRKHQKLLTFLASPDTSLQIFFSWYLHHQGFIYSPSYLSYLPRLVLFFVEFLLKTKTMPESERALRKAIEVAKKAVKEVPAAGRLCKLLPDKVGMGCLMLWGKRWVDEEGEQPFFVKADPLPESEETKEEAMKRFEEELKKENVQILSSENLVPPEASETFPGLVDDDEHISIQVTSPTSPGFVDPDEIPAAFIEEVIEPDNEVGTTRADSKSQVCQRETRVSATLEAVQPASPAILANPEVKADPTSDAVADATPPASANSQSIPWRWDTVPSDDPARSSEAQDLIDAWKPRATQPLMALLGMTVLPLKYEAGVAERSMRKVKAVVGPGDKAKEGLERKWRGVQEELVGKLARVVLEPWVDWDDGGLAEMYRKPRMQTPMKEKFEDQAAEREKGKKEHDPFMDVIVVLMEPRVAEQVSVGMGLAGTWVQLARIQGDRGEPSGRGGSRGRGRGRGGGRGRGRGGLPPHARTGGDQTEDTSKQSADNDEVGPEASVVAADVVVDARNESEELEAGSTTVTTTGARGGGGRGRGRGGHHFHYQAEKEFVFWYVEDLFMAVPSFWMAGKEEEPLTMEDVEGQGDDDPGGF